MSIVNKDESLPLTKIQYNPNDLVLDRYRVINKFGEGGMSSTIYKAEDINIKEDDHLLNKDKYVAIKVINRDEKLFNGQEWIKFHDECITSQRITNRKNIVNTFEVSKINDGNTIVIVMEYVDGISLQSRLQQIGNFNVKEAIYYFEKILEAIKELHSFRDKIIHRDLKPDNIMITKDLMNIKIIDFGISSVVIESTLRGGTETITHEDAIWGSPPYVSPDILKTNKPGKGNVIGVQFDFFSLGVIFYEMLIGEKPFKTESENDSRVIKMPLKYDMMCISEINPSIPVAIENIIFRCLASKDEDLKYRYQRVEEIISDLHECNNNKEKAIFAKLLKPKNERTLQLTNAFNVSAQKLKEKFYEQYWFYWLMLSIAVVMIILVVVLACLHDLR